MSEVFLFELRFRLRQVSTYIFAGVLFLLAVLFVSTDAVQISGGGARVQGNAPYVIAFAGTILAALGSVIVSAVVGTAIYRDFETQAHELFFTTRLTKAAYLLGRFLGAFVIALFVFAAIPLGLLAGTVMPWADHAIFGPLRPEAYLSFFLVQLVPNLLLVSALFFTLGALTRSLLAIYVQGILLLVGWIIAQRLLGSLENRELAAYLDPFGVGAIALATRYWTATEKNTALLPLSGPILYNRLLWTAVAIGVFAIGYRLFTFSRNPLALRQRRPAETVPVASESGGRVPTVPIRPDAIRAYLDMTGFYFREIVRGVPFLVITIGGVVLLLTAAFQADKIFDTTVYPVTRVIVETIAGAFALFFLILITFYAGELTWRERVLRLDQISDALPIPTAAQLLAKVTAVLLMLTVLNFGLIATGVLVQAIKGYYQFDLPLYGAYLFGIVFPGLICLTFLAFFLHALINNKFLGHAAMIVVFTAIGVLPTLGWEHNLYLFGGTPTVVYSDMNRWGPYITPFVWFTVYWTAGSVLLLLLAQRLWVRGKDDLLRTRWLRGTIGMGGRAVALLAAAIFVGSGAYIYNNTNVLNDYVTQKAATKRQAGYERSYKADWAKKPMPRVTDVKMDVDLRPEDRRYFVRGTYRLRNKTVPAVPIREVALQFDPDLTIKEVRFGIAATPGITDRKTGFRTFTLARPLQPGEETTLDFDLAYEKRGFPNSRMATNIVKNGTFLTMPGPSIGYQEGGEIQDETERRKQKLPPRRRMPAVTDLEARRNTYLGNDADWIGFEATVRTSADQTAIAPGYLQKEWTENGRRCFHYKMDAPIRNFYSFLSARYALKRDTWTSPEGKRIALEIYYHPSHAYNLDRMMRGMKDALAYCSKNFAPYQFRQLRILEFPAYAQFAQSFPNTVPYSESIGFIARVDDAAEDIDYPYYVTAHETAHQWWAHQVLGGNVEGSEMLSESLAEYSAFMILQQRYGKDRIYRFLRYDLDRYLRGRSTAREAENPLVKVQNQQYIHYPKGALVFYALADRIGEARLNATLSRFTGDKRFQEPPYTTGMELLSYLRADARGVEEQRYLTDLFEKITLYDCRATKATASKLPGGKWKVTLTVSAEKLYAEQPTTLDDTFDIGVFARPVAQRRDPKALGKPIAWERRHFTGKEQTLTFEVAEEPYKAGIDPYNKLIDRQPTDNVTTVTVE